MFSTGISSEDGVLFVVRSVLQEFLFEVAQRAVLVDILHSIYTTMSRFMLVLMLVLIQVCRVAYRSYN